MSIAITKDNYATEIETSKQPVIIDVYASWCSPCQQMAPIFDEVAKELGSQYKFAKLNVDEAREIAIQFGVTSVPTFIFLKDNKVVSRTIGFMDKQELMQKIRASFS